MGPPPVSPRGDISHHPACYQHQEPDAGWRLLAKLEALVRCQPFLACLSGTLRHQPRWPAHRDKHQAEPPPIRTSPQPRVAPPNTTAGPSRAQKSP